MAFFRPKESPLHPWIIAPAAAPAAKSELTAPSMDAVYELLGSSLKYLKKPGWPMDVTKTAKLEEFSILCRYHVKDGRSPEAICECAEGDEGDNPSLI